MDRDSLDRQARIYEHQLTDGSKAMEYLLGRGLTKRTIRSARLGYVDTSGPRAFRHRIAIPYLGAGGHSLVKTIRYRGLDLVGDAPKYLSPKGLKTHLYNVEATSAKDVWLCEGEFDSLILGQMGLPSVGIAGASSFKPAWKYLFSSAQSVTLVMDADEAGRKAANRIASILGDITPIVRLASLPDGSDVTDLFLEKGADEVRRLVM